jgi:putative addiction module killer protein
MGNCEPVGEGVFELKIHWGPGYRICFGQIRYRVIFPLCGGIKKTQSMDIAKAKEYWRDYRRRL